VKTRLAFVLALAAACSRAPESASPQKPQQAAAAANVLELSHGATLFAYVPEQSYGNAGAHTLDAEELTSWISPPFGTDQTFVIALPARTRIRQIGMTAAGGLSVPHLGVDSSLDGAQWTPVGTLAFASNGSFEVRAVKPFESRYLRFRTMTAKNQNFAQIFTLYAAGDELEAAKPGSIDGCWTINNRAARFEQHGAQVRGVLDPGEHEKTMQLDGGFDGRAYRLIWRAGAQWGDAMFTVSPDGKAMSGVNRHRSGTDEGFADGFIGERGPCATTPFDPSSIREYVIADIHRYPLYALRFDARDRLLVDESAAALDVIAGLKNVRLVARNAPARITSLRDALAARGVDTTQYAFVDGKSAGRPPLYTSPIDLEPK
jgi:hypothetical protein